MTGTLTPSAAELLQHVARKKVTHPFLSSLIKRNMSQHCISLKYLCIGSESPCWQVFRQHM